jgi:hypothetical protein
MNNMELKKTHFIKLLRNLKHVDIINSVFLNFNIKIFPIS